MAEGLRESTRARVGAGLPQLAARDRVRNGGDGPGLSASCNAGDAAIAGRASAAKLHDQTAGQIWHVSGDWRQSWGRK